MIQKVNGRKLNMPMLEIIITLGILTIVSVFLMRLFLGANSLETKAKDISKACILAENTAETIKAAASYESALQELSLNQVSLDEDDIYRKYYDSQWKEQQQPATYTMEIAMTKTSYDQSMLLAATITVSKDKPYAVIKEEQEPLAKLECKSYKNSFVSASAGQ